MEYVTRYTQFLSQFYDVKKPLRVIFDGSNGVAGKVVAALAKGLPMLEATVINDSLDANFKAHGPNPLATGARTDLETQVKNKNADLGVIFDADGDRAIFIDEKGQMVHPYVISMLLSQIKKVPFVLDEIVYTSLSFLNALPPEAMIPSKVGHFFIKEHMREKKAEVGAEQSGHYYFKDFFFADSGIFAAIQVMNALSRLNSPLSAFAAQFPLEMVMHNVKLSREWKEIEPKLREWAEAHATVAERDGLTLVFADGFINIRTSNTEPLLRFVAGARTESRAKEIIKEVELVCIF